MQLEQILQFLISGITAGSIYALTALGFTIIYNSTNIINFAQGEFVMLGGMFANYFHFALKLPLSVAVFLAIFTVTLIGGVFERVAIYPQRKASILTLIIITIGGSILLKSVALHLFGENPVGLPPFLPNEPIEFFKAVVLPQEILIFIITLVVFAVLQIFYKYTMLGKAMRACADNRIAAQLMGININTLVFISFALSAGLGALGGAIITPISLISFNSGGMLGLKGFAAAILGGLGNPFGAFIGGILLGILESVSIGFISAGFKDAIALLILLLVLFIKPSGILGGSVEEKV
jgi:branched-chain amino acid transport system permease protein